MFLSAFNVFRLFYPAALPGSFYSYLNPLCIIIGVSYTTFYKHKKREQREEINVTVVDRNKSN